MKMIADSSIWIDHLKKANPVFQSKLEDLDVYTHSAVILELALGNLKNRKEVLGYFEFLPKATEASVTEIMQMVNQFKLFGIGLGAIDVQILASAKLSQLAIFTRDQAMIRAMKVLKIDRFEC